MTRQASGWRYAGYGGLLLLTACAPTRRAKPPAPPATGEASWRQVSTPGMVHYQLALGEVEVAWSLFNKAHQALSSRYDDRHPEMAGVYNGLAMDELARVAGSHDLTPVGPPMSSEDADAVLAAAH